MSPLPNPYDARQVGKSYDAVRPQYPAAALEALLAAAPNQLRNVADIGAGTGILTRQLQDALPEATIFAVEPSAQMRGENEVQHWVDGTSEATTLPDRSIDLVVWAQSFHWVDPVASGAEAQRILAPDGIAAVLVNQLDVSQPWVHRLSRIMRSGDVHRPDRPPKLPGFTTDPVQIFPWEQLLTVEQLMELARTRSSYLGANPHTRKRMQANLHWYLKDFLHFETEVSVPYFTYLWLVRL